MNSPNPDPLWQDVALDIAATFRPLDLAVAVDTNSRAALVVAEEILGAPGPAPPGRPRLSLAVVLQEDAGAHLEERHRYRQRRGVFAAAGDGVLVAADLDAGTAAAFVAEGALAPSSGGAELALGAPVWRFAARRGLVAIHAAAVAMASGTAVLRGPSGAGKSTVALACGVAGGRVLADEVTWFDPLGAVAVLRGGRPTLAVAQRGAAELGPLPAGARADAAGKLLVPIAALAGGRAHRAPVGPLVFLARGRTTSWRPVDAPIARERFDNELLPGEQTQSAAQIQAARDALVRAGAYELTVGRPTGAPAAVEEICADAPRRRPTE